MAGPIELKIGQVWATKCGDQFKLVAIGPSHVGVVRITCGDSLPRLPSYDLWSIEFLHVHCTLLRPKHELWVNVYRYESGYMAGAGHASEADAKKGAAYSDGKGAEYRIACLKIEFEEGEGL